MSEFLRDSIWQFVGSIIAVIALLVSIYIFLLQKRKKSLHYQIMTEADLLTINEEIRGKIKILFEDSSIQNVSLIVLKIINNGNLPIASSDFERPLSFSFGQNARILSAEITQKVPKTLQPNLDVHSNQIKLVPMLLNGKDSITVKLLVEQYSKRVEPDARIIGVSEIREIRTNPMRDRDMIMMVLASSIIAVVLAFVYDLSLIATLTIYFLLAMTFFAARKFLLRRSVEDSTS